MQQQTSREENQAQGGRQRLVWPVGVVTPIPADMHGITLTTDQAVFLLVPMNLKQPYPRDVPGQIEFAQHTASQVIQALMDLFETDPSAWQPCEQTSQANVPQAGTQES